MIGPMIQFAGGWIRADQIDSISLGEMHRGSGKEPPRQLSLTVRLRSGHSRMETWNTTYAGSAGPQPEEWQLRETRLRLLLEDIAAVEASP